MAETARAGARRPPREGTRPPRRTVDRIGRGMGGGGRRRADAPRRAAAAMAKSATRRVGIETSTRHARGSSRAVSYLPTSSRATARSRRRRSGHGSRSSRTATCRSTTCSSRATGTNGVLDWSEAGLGDALYDLATLTLGHEEHVGDVAAGYGTVVDLDIIRGWWSRRCLSNIRWLIEHGFDPFLPGCEVDVLRLRGCEAAPAASRLKNDDRVQHRLSSARSASVVPAYDAASMRSACRSRRRPRAVQSPGPRPQGPRHSSHPRGRAGPRRIG